MQKCLGNHLKGNTGALLKSTNTSNEYQQYIFYGEISKIISELLPNNHLNSFPASGDFCRLLITYANSLDPDKARQNDLDPNCMTL